MHRQSLSQLAQFCVEQHAEFRVSAWIDRGGFDERGLAEAAEYLSRTSWYGHEASLAAVAAKLRALLACRAGASRGDAAEIPLAEFSIRTRYLLALRRAEVSRAVHNEGPIS